MLKLILVDDAEVIDEYEFNDSLTHSAFLAVANMSSGPAKNAITKALKEFDYDADLQT